MLALCPRQLARTACNANKRGLFHWINLQFNVLDEERRQLYGPDRTCAEWILRNGGSVKFAGINDITEDYNALPHEEVAVKLREVRAINCSIMGSGFRHFEGCNHINKVIFRQCNYLENDALKGLLYLQHTLEYLEVADCLNINDDSLSHFKGMTALRNVTLEHLPGVKNKDKVLELLKQDVPQANVQFN